MDKDWSIKILDKELMLRNLDEILKIESDTSDLLGISYAVPWKEDSFLSERDMKWELSTISFDKNNVTGFLINSRFDGNKSHAHRGAMITTLPSDEKKKIFRYLYAKLDEQAKRNGIIYRTATVPLDNISTQKFYLNEGWLELNKKEVEEFILQKNIDGSVIEPNIMLDRVVPPGDPNKSKIYKYVY